MTVNYSNWFGLRTCEARTNWKVNVTPPFCLPIRSVLCTIRADHLCYKREQKTWHEGFVFVSPTVRNNTSSLLSHLYTCRSHPFMMAVLCTPCVSMLILIMEVVRAVSRVGRWSETVVLLNCVLDGVLQASWNLALLLIQLISLVGHSNGMFHAINYIELIKWKDPRVIICNSEDPVLRSVE
jgi:hypothetical protein